ncbi:MAG TPA: hypothetical protein VMM78_03025 [Thermomicrobiales bacterium]|nr:hypothetical protein [Thermomicrobiales bacterium]
MSTTISEPATFVHRDDAIADLHAAMFNAIAAFAEEAGMPAASARDFATAGRQSVSMASVYADLCRALGVREPAVVRDALC